MSREQTLMLGVGDYGASRTQGQEIKTMALGSCVSVILLDPAVHCVGMVHVALPDSSVNQARAEEKPGYFADTGIPALILRMVQLGCQAGGRGWIVKLIGGANVADQSNIFNIGKRNVVAIKKILWKLKMAPRKEDVGGNYSRTVSVDVARGRVIVSSPGRGNWQV